MQESIRQPNPERDVLDRKQRMYYDMYHDIYVKREDPRLKRIKENRENRAKNLYHL